MQITIPALRLDNFHPLGMPGAVVYLRFYALQPFTAQSNLQIIQPGAPARAAFFQQESCSVSGGSLYLPELTLESTTDALNPGDRSARYFAGFFRPDGSLLQPYYKFEQFALPSMPGIQTWAQISAYNSAGVPQPPNYDTYTKDQIGRIAPAPNPHTYVDPLVFEGSTLSLPRASVTQNGYLSKEDWFLFSPEGVVAVTSFNTRTGDIILFDDDVLAALGYVPGTVIPDKGYVDNLAGTKVPLAGGIMTGPLQLPPGPPSNSLHAVTKAYAESLIVGGSGSPRLAGDVYLSEFNASGLPSVYTGSVSAGSTNLMVDRATDFVVGQGIFILNAGTGGSKPFITKVDALSGTTITLHDPVISGVTNKRVQHDDSDAFQAAFDFIKAANGGRVLAGAGVFKVNKPPTVNNAILNLPFVPNPDTSMLYIKSFSLIGNQPFIAGHFTSHDPEVATATVIETELRDVNAWIMVGGQYTTAYGAGNHAYIYIENIIFRTYDDPQINCLDLATCWSVSLKGVGCDSGLGVQAMTFPTHDTIGVRLPMLNTNSITYTELLCVRGYGIGVVGSELWKSYTTWVEHCKVGIQTHDSTANYPIVGDFLIGNCATGIYCKTSVRLDINVTYEVAPSGSYYMGYGIHDPTNASTGIVRYYAYFIGLVSSHEIDWTGCSGVTIWSMDGFGIKWGNQRYFQLPLGTDLQVDDLQVRGKTYLNDGSAQEPVTFGTADSGGTGFRHAIAPNVSTLTTGIVSYWTLDEPSGVRYDMTGRYDLKPPASGNVPSGAGKIGLGLNGDGSYYLSHRGFNSADLPGSLSVAGWINFNALGSWQPIFGDWPYDGVNNSFVLLHRPDTNNAELWVSSNGNATAPVSVALTAATGTWYFLAAYYNSAGTLGISLNGAPFVTAAAGFTGAIHAPSNLAVLIYGGGASNLKLDELGLWAKALTIGEVGTLYASGAGRTYPF